MKHTVTLATAFLTFAVGQSYAAERLETTVVETANEASVSHRRTALSADEIANTSINTIEDVTRYIPGVQVNDSGNRFSDNGFNIRGLEGDAVAVTVDGVSLGETLAPPAFSAYGMYDSNRGQVEIEHVKLIEITKGPSSVSNGEAALAGSVAYTTYDPVDFLIESGDTFYQGVKAGFDSRSDEGMYNLTLANRTGSLESLLMVTIRDSDEMKAHDDGFYTHGPGREQADPLDREALSILLKLSYEVADGQRIGFAYDRTDRTADGIILSRNATLLSQQSYDNFRTDDNNDKERFEVSYDWADAENILFDSLSAAFNYQELYTSGVSNFEFASRGASYLRQEDRSTEQDVTSVNVDLEKALDGAGLSHSLTYGIRWETREIYNERWDRRWNGLDQSTGTRNGYPISDPAWVPETEREAFNFYLRDDIAVNEKLTLTVGVRYDTTEYSPELDATFADASGESVVDSDFSQVVGGLQGAYEFLPGHSFLMSYSQGYKAPTFQDLYLSTDGSETITDTVTGVEFIDLDAVANSDLEAEESESFEIGYKLESARASLTVTAYWTDYDNLIRNADVTRAYNPSVNSEACAFNFATRTSTCTPAILTQDEYRQPQNAGAVEVNGIELDAIYAWNDNVYTSFTFATIDGEYKDSLANSHNSGDDLETASPDSATLGIGYQADDDKWGVVLHTVWFDEVSDSNDLSFTSLNNASGPASEPDAYTVFDVTAFYEFSDNLRVTGAIYNVTDEVYFRWEVLNSVRPGNGGFFGGVSDNGILRYSEPGRSFSGTLSYSF
jgi:hemoglobin/transferrin/lactoferrin receptor protein